MIHLMIHSTSSLDPFSDPNLPSIINNLRSAFAQGVALLVSAFMPLLFGYESKGSMVTKLDTHLPNPKDITGALKHLISLKSLSETDRIITKNSFLQALKCTGTTWLLTHSCYESPDTCSSTARSPPTGTRSLPSVDLPSRPAHGQHHAHEHQIAHEHHIAYGHQIAHGHTLAHGHSPVHGHQTADEQDHSSSTASEGNSTPSQPSVIKHLDFLSSPTLLTPLPDHHGFLTDIANHDRRGAEIRAASSAKFNRVVSDHVSNMRLHALPCLGATGVEPWVIDSILKKDSTTTHRWCDRDRWESPYENQIRFRVFTAFKACLPREFYWQLVDGDVTGLYTNLTSLGGKESAEQIATLLHQLDTTNKIGIPMARWLMELSDINERLVLLRYHTGVKAFRIQLFRDLKHDSRYEPVVRDLKRNPEWSRTRIHHVLEAAASDIDDLLSPIASPCAEAPHIHMATIPAKWPIRLMQEVQTVINKLLLRKKGKQKRTAKVSDTMRAESTQAPCSSFTTYGTCTHPGKCHFSHAPPPTSS